MMLDAYCNLGCKEGLSATLRTKAYRLKGDRGEGMIGLAGCNLVGSVRRSHMTRFLHENKTLETREQCDDCITLD